MPKKTHSRRELLAATGGALLVGLAGCSSEASEPSETPPTTTEPPATPTPEDTGSETETPSGDDEASGEPVIRMITDNKGSYFDPKGLRIEPGTTVTFVNASGSHATAAYHPNNDDKPLRMPEAGTPWFSEIFTESGVTVEHTFEAAGVYDFYCPPHEMLGMVGRIVVASPDGGPATVPPEDVPPGAQDAFPSIEAILEDGVVSGP